MQAQSPKLNPRQRAFLRAYEQTCQVCAAATAAAVDRNSHYKWLAEDPAYKAAFEASRELGAQALEDEAVRRAHIGVDEPVVYQGQFSYPLTYQLGEDGKPDKSKPLVIDPSKPLVIRKYSDVLLIFLLKGLRPLIYRENIKAEITGEISIAERLIAARKRVGGGE